MEKLFRPDGPCAHGHVPTPAIVCSQDSGAIWTKPQAFDVGGDFPRIAVGSDGSVYAVSITVDASKITLTRFSSCANGLAKQFSTELFINLDVFCPVSGLDRCNIPMLVNPTVAVDDTDPNHIYIAYASTGGSSVQNIRVTDSTDGGRTFLRSVQLNANIAARRSCPGSASQAELPTSLGMIARPQQLAPTTSLVSTLAARSLTPAHCKQNLTANADPQCASGFPCGADNAKDFNTCPNPPNPPPPVSPRGGCPKYGDYNGNAAISGRVYAAWASATAPPGLPNPNGIGVFFTRVDVSFPPELFVPLKPLPW
jgi:hypothetical protein